MHQEGRAHFLNITHPSKRLAVQRCTADGKPTQTDWTHWQLITRKWADRQRPEQQELATQAAGARVCSRCGAPADWLVAVLYGSATQAGRLLVYCETCRREFENRIGAALPVSVLEIDAETALSMLYRSGATLSDPQGAADVLPAPPGRWMDLAAGAIAGVEHAAGDGDV